jgi:predicted metal-dependent peptidase
VDWREELAEFVSSTHKSEAHTWTRPSRRIPGLPGWNRDPEHRLVICIDTSGSIGDDLLNIFTAEIKAVTAINGTTCHFISCDASVHEVIAPGDLFPTEWSGGGGTDFRPAINKAIELEPDAIIYLTDGQGTFPSGCPIPVLWALTEKTAVPFGRTVMIEK